MKVLLIAGGGTLGTYTARELIKLGYEIDVITLEALQSNQPQLKYLQAKVDDTFLADFLLQNNYDAIVDFIHYPEPEKYRSRCEFMLGRTKHLIFLSSYRVYADKEHPITENAPQLPDVYKDDQFLMLNDHYGVSKSYEERILRESGHRNWTIVRPLISFSHLRLDLVTQGAGTLLTRPAQGKPILLPEKAANLTAGLTWAGNTGKMIAHLVLNESAFSEDFTLGTGENRTWREIAGVYTTLNKAEFVWVDSEAYLRYATLNQVDNRIMLYYDRLFDRKVDNSKILSVTDLNAQDLWGIEESLAYEMARAVSEPDARLVQSLNSETTREINRRMDFYFRKH